MLRISNALGFVFKGVMAPFRSLPLTGMVVISVLTGVLMLIIYKYTSDQKGITGAKNKIKANFLAIMLFSDSFIVLLKSIGRILRWNLVYMGHNLRPLAVMIAPVLLLLVQLNFWYGYRPVEVGESALVKVKTARNVDLSSTDAVLEAPEGVTVETPAVRAPQTGEVTWRVAGAKEGAYNLIVKIGDELKEKRVVVGPPSKLHALAPLRHNGNFADGLLYPGEKKLTGSIRSISVQYPEVKMNFFGWHTHWIIVYFILSIVAGLGMKGLFKVDI